MTKAVAASRPSAFEALRLAEIQDAIELLRRHGRLSGELLEIGAGTGWQARALSEAGFRVKAIDLPADSAVSGHARNRHWPIRDYDGTHIPYPDESFDIIYSSNVLEHVADLDALTDEMKRVLRPDGVALHLLPNPQWRILSLATYYPGQTVDLLRYLKKHALPPVERSNGNELSVAHPAKGRSLLLKALERLLPPAHGAVGNAVSEISRYSRHSWDRYFRQNGWEIIAYDNNGLVASGDYLLGSALDIPARRRIGGLVGGIAHVYLLRPQRSD
jgi:SAM-dependent methyltransferase